ETNVFSEKFTGPVGIKLCVAVLPLSVHVKTKTHKENIDEGDSVTLNCGSENCYRNQESFLWFKNQHLLPEVTKNKLRLSSVNHTDHANYSCALNNSNILPSREFLLDVRYHPQDVEIRVLSSGEIQEGNAVTLLCKSKANPAVHNYSWFQIREANKTSVGSERELYITSASPRDDGLYFCIATNEMGSKKSPVFALKVKVVRQLHFLLMMVVGCLCGVAALTVFLTFRSGRRKKKQSTEQTTVQHSRAKHSHLQPSEMQRLNAQSNL
ncbi:hypothetical protein DNTS_005494, partial [Danionella cerebrum]